MLGIACVQSNTDAQVDVQTTCLILAYMNETQPEDLYCLTVFQNLMSHICRQQWRLVNTGRWGTAPIKLAREEADFNVFKNKLNIPN